MTHNNEPPAEHGANATLQQALHAYRSGDISRAIPMLRSLAGKHPDDAQILFYLGTAELQCGNAAQSADLLYRSARQLANPNTFNNLGLALQRLGQHDRALGAFERAIRLNPHYADAHFNKGVALQALNEPEKALHSYESAIECKPAYASAYSNKSAVLRELKRLDDALISCERAIQLKPDSAGAYANRGNVLIDLGRPGDALQCYERAVQLQPDCAEAHNNRAGALSDLDRLSEALQGYERAIELKPDYAEAHRNRAETLRDLGRLDEALVSYERAIALKPDNNFWAGDWLYAKLSICDWSGFPGCLEMISGAIEAHRRVTAPFATLLTIDSLPLQKQAAEIWVEDRYPPRRGSPASSARSGRGKIRLAYVSADFHDHATMHLIAEMLEQHDRSRFELIGISFGPKSNHAWRKRAERCFERFVDVGDRSDQEAAELARTLGVDVAVDLKGFTKDARPGIFADRCAPIQVSYLGYPGTIGAPFMDYVIADRTVIPEESRKYFTEKVAYLPHCYQANCRDREVADELVSRMDCGLPDASFVFCCFNGSSKIVPAVFDSWMRILNRCDAGVLWLLETNRWAAANLRAEAQRRGVGAERLVFAKLLPVDRHLNRLRHADLFLDTRPYNAHTTASDALRMGVPLLTQIGTTFASRVAASLLQTLELGELIAHSTGEYEERAVALATTPGLHSVLRQRLLASVNTAPLYDSKLFTRSIEALYEKMCERHRRGLPPEHIDS